MKMRKRDYKKQAWPGKIILAKCSIIRLSIAVTILGKHKLLIEQESAQYAKLDYTNKNDCFGYISCWELTVLRGQVDKCQEQEMKSVHFP
jgi:hypothetical protein